MLCPALTFIAPANMIALTNAKIKLVDIDPLTYTIDPKLIEKKITKNTKAIIVVHQFGHAAKMDEIMKIAKKYNLKLSRIMLKVFVDIIKIKNSEQLVICLL